MQLGHRGDACPHPSAKTRTLVIGHVNGVHEVDVRFCRCVNDDDDFEYEWVQLFREGWYPATTTSPATAFTFELLNTFQELNFQAKTSLYDFWKTIERITDNSGAPVYVSSDISSFRESNIAHNPFHIASL